MFNLFKKDLNQITENKFLLLALLAASCSMSSTMLLMTASPKRDEKTLGLLLFETLVYVTALVQLRAQSHFRFKDPYQIVVMIQKLQDKYGELARAAGIKSDNTPVSDTPTMPVDILENATTSGFLERVSIYVARDYEAMGVTEESFDQFCRMTGGIASLLKKAGVNLATVMFEIAAFGLILPEQGASAEQMGLLHKRTWECREFLVEKIDALLKRNL